MGPARPEAVGAHTTTWWTWHLLMLCASLGPKWQAVPSPSALIDQQQPTKLVLLARLTSWINSCKHELDHGLVQLLIS